MNKLYHTHTLHMIKSYSANMDTGKWGFSNLRRSIKYINTVQKKI